MQNYTIQFNFIVPVGKFVSIRSKWHVIDQNGYLLDQNDITPNNLFIVGLYL